MKTISYLSILLFLLSCGGFTRTISGTTKNDLLKQVAVENNCPRDNVTIIKKHNRAGGGTFLLDVCGKEMVYRQLGYSIHKVSEDQDEVKEDYENLLKK